MQADDDGFFHYNQSYMPLGVKPPACQEQDFHDAMNHAVLHYLQDSYRNGKKDARAILPCDMSVGEAAVCFFRNNTSKRKSIPNPMDTSALFRLLQHSFQQHMAIDVTAHEVAFRDLLASTSASRRGSGPISAETLIPLIKTFLQRINMKCKGYTHKLKFIHKDIRTYMSEEHAAGSTSPPSS